MIFAWICAFTDRHLKTIKTLFWGVEIQKRFRLSVRLFLFYRYGCFGSVEFGEVFDYARVGLKANLRVKGIRGFLVNIMEGFNCKIVLIKY